MRSFKLCMSMTFLGVCTVIPGFMTMFQGQRCAETKTAFLKKIVAQCVLKVLYCSSLSHRSLNREGRWGTTDDFATIFLHFSLFSTALCDLAYSRPAHHSLMLFSHLFLCLPCLRPPFTVPCKMVLARLDERET